MVSRDDNDDWDDQRGEGWIEPVRGVFGETGAAQRALPTIDEVPADVRMFLEGMTSNPPLNIYLAGARAGWSPAEVDERMRDKEFAALTEGCRELVLDGIEAVVVRRALNGNLTAALRTLEAYRPETWATKREVHHTGKVTLTGEEKEAAMQGAVDYLRSIDSTEARRAAIASRRQRAIEARSVDVSDGDES